MNIKRLKKNHFWIAFGFFSFFLFNFFSLNFSLKAQVSEVPVEYFANYKIQKDRDRLTKLFIDIDANRKIGVINTSAIFSELHNIMKRVFPYFPQDYASQVLYQQCLSTVENMQKNSDRDTFAVFYENCYKPIQNLSSTIASKYTIKAQGTANPSQGAAPLTVTFDARASLDPSKETIPNKNYFWYYRDIDGVDRPIGVGATIKHTFREAGTYMVHLVVRSSQTGILDGEKTISVNVSPKSAVITVYANAKKLDKNVPVKFGIQEAVKGVVFDGSATMPMGGREILSHRWDIIGSNNEGFKFTRNGEGVPGYFNLPLPNQGQYKVILTVTDNEKNQISESFSILISDPVAILKQTPEVGNTSTTFNFSSDASYSLTSRIRLVTWEVIDESGDKKSFQSRTIKQKFTKPGNYTVKLTVEDELGQTNIDTKLLLIESTPPIPQFTITPTNKWLYPSEFYLDAQSSYDIDVANAGDELTFDRSFSNPNVFKITERDEKNQRIKVLFNEIGKHTITLEVKDKYGKVEKISKEVEVKSIIRPELTINPRAAIWKTYLDFIVESNVGLLTYEWNFGDGTQRTNQKNQMKYQYDKVGSYPVTVKVTDIDGNINQVSSMVFIGEKDRPIPVYMIKSSLGTILTQNETCSIDGKEDSARVPAYRVKRQEKFILDISDSVNAQGNKNSLQASFQPKDRDIIQAQQLNYAFDTIGCQYIDYTLEDTSIAVNAKERIWFKVVNDLPTLSNVVISFPQYGNEMGIGFGENNVRDIFSSGIDPVIVRVAAQSPKDKDGVISYYKRYYYPKDNPNKILSTKITPGDIPYAFFTVPAQPGEFMFGVTMYDNDDGKQSSEDIIGNGPVVFFPPNTAQPDIPLVTLKSDKVNVDVGEQVTFDVISKILSERSDFVKERTIQIDFEGDGIIDLTTKNDRIQHQYTKPSPTKEPYLPKAYVTYRGYKGEGEAASIIVKNAVKPAFIYTTLGKTVIIKDISLGNIIERSLCFDLEQCEKGNKRYLNTSLDNPLIVSYPEYGDYTLKINIKDDNGNEVEAEQKISIPETSNAISVTTGINFVTVPEAQVNVAGIPEIFVGRALNNEVVFYIDSRDAEGYCFVDSNIDIDSNNDGVTENDKDFYCNKPYLYSYIPNVESIRGRIYYLPKKEDGTFENRPITKDFLVTFADFDNGLDEATNKVYEKINQLLTTLDDQTWLANGTLRVLMTTLRNELLDRNKTRENVIMVNQFIKENPLKLTENEEKLLGNILIDLQDFVTLSAEGENAYVIAKNEIIYMVPKSLEKEIRSLFASFDALSDQQGSGNILEQRKNILREIYLRVATIAKDNEVNDDQIFKEDFEAFFIPAYCQIVQYFSISDDPYCGHYFSGEVKLIPDEEIVPGDRETTGFALPGRLKILIRIVGIMVLAFVLIIVFYAVKAELKKQKNPEG